MWSQIKHAMFGEILYYTEMIDYIDHSLPWKLEIEIYDFSFIITLN